MSLAPDYTDRRSGVLHGTAERTAVLAAAEAAAAQIADDHHSGDLVIVARLPDGGYRTLGGSHVVGPLRASVAAAVASGNTRLWDGVVGIETTECSVRSLPEIIRSTAELSRVTAVHVGCVHDGAPVAIAVWFEIDGRVVDPARRREMMEILTLAAERQRDVLARLAAEAALATVETDHRLPDDGRCFDGSDPDFDATTGLPARAAFERIMDAFDGDEAALIVIAVEATATDQVSRAIADRLVATCTPADLVARLDADRFVVVPDDPTRAASMQLAKRLLGAFAEPFERSGGPVSVSASVAFAHQFGLVDTEELFEAAEDAVDSARRSGGGRLLIAS